ncbi:MAG: tRNA lysidine(34) synthetase TilS [Phycisphaerae bacterium]
MTDSAKEALVSSTARFIDAHAPLAPYSAVVVGVSGGPDSVALLAVLRELARDSRRAYRITVAHLHHGLREAADEEADFVAELARHWELPCLMERVDTAQRARESGFGIEQTARMLRYEFLRRAAENVGAAVVAVGHHADDNVETVLHRVVRGTHLRGLAGIPTERAIGGGVRLVRPLLWARREQIESYLHAHDLPSRQDETNTDVGFARNFIRHELLPLIRERLNPRADEALLRLAKAAAEADEYIAARAEELLEKAVKSDSSGRVVLSADVLAGEHRVVRTSTMRGVLERLGAPMRSVGAERLGELAELAEPAAAGAVTLGGGVTARRRRDEIVVTVGVSAGGGDGPWSLELACPGETKLPDGRKVVCEPGPLDTDELASRRDSPEQGVELLDADALNGHLRARDKREGDSFVPLGAPGRQSVSDFLTNAKLPQRQREQVVCICDELGIVYLAPLRIDDRVKVTDCTRRVLRIRIDA